jgi:hypothetical protein
MHLGTVVITVDEVAVAEESNCGKRSRAEIMPFI